MWSAGPLACPFAPLLAPLICLLALDCSLRSRPLLHSLVRSLAHFAHSRAHGKMNDWMSHNDLVLSHSALLQWLFLLLLILLLLLLLHHRHYGCRWGLGGVSAVSMSRGCPPSIVVVCVPRRRFRRRHRHVYDRHGCRCRRRRGFWWVVLPSRVRWRSLRWAACCVFWRRRRLELLANDALDVLVAPFVRPSFRSFVRLRWPARRRRKRRDEEEEDEILWNPILWNWFHSSMIPNNGCTRPGKITENDRTKLG